MNPHRQDMWRCNGLHVTALEIVGLMLLAGVLLGKLVAGILCVLLPSIRPRAPPMSQSRASAGYAASRDGAGYAITCTHYTPPVDGAGYATSLD